MTPGSVPSTERHSPPGSAANDFDWNKPCRCQDCGRVTIDPVAVSLDQPEELCPNTGERHRWINDEKVWDEVDCRD